MAGNKREIVSSSRQTRRLGIVLTIRHSLAHLQGLEVQEIKVRGPRRELYFGALIYKLILQLILFSSLWVCETTHSRPLTAAGTY